MNILNNENTFIDENNEESLLDPKSDIVFKQIFGKQENKNLLRSFLNNILELTSENEIVDLDFFSNEIVPVVTSDNAIKNENVKKNVKENVDKQNNENKKGRGGRMDLLVNPYRHYRPPYNFRNTDQRKRFKISGDDDIELIGKTKSNELINIEIQVDNKGIWVKDLYIMHLEYCLILYL